MDPEDRCLPDTGLTGWMKRTMERSYDLSDFCNSPPVDGFYYPANLQQKGTNQKGNCSPDSLNRSEELKTCKVMGATLSINQAQSLDPSISTNLSMYQSGGLEGMAAARGCVKAGDAPNVPGYLKPIVGGMTTSAFSKQTRELNNPKVVSMGATSTTSEKCKDLVSTPEEVRSCGEEMYLGSEHGCVLQSHPTDDSAPTPVDHVISARFTPTIQISGHEEDGTSLRLVEKLGAVIRSCPATPDVTPNATPAVTPASSPQVARRTGNPFFTEGTDDPNAGGSWLFRPGKKPSDGNSLKPERHYEAKIEYQHDPNAKGSKKTVRYVPRPSELRELNFWSPTSM